MAFGKTHICTKVAHEFVIIYYKWKVELIVMHNNLKSFASNKSALCLSLSLSLVED